MDPTATENCTEKSSVKTTTQTGNSYNIGPNEPICFYTEIPC